MTSAKIWVAALAILSLSAISADALVQTKRTVKAGQRSQIFFHVTWVKETCAFAPSGSVSVLNAPSHGKITLERMKGPIPAGNCVGYPAVGTAVFYTPDSGYRGADSVVLDVRWPSNVGQNLDLAGDRLGIALTVQ